MKKIILLSGILALLILQPLQAQGRSANSGSAQFGGVVSGNVIDASDGKPLEYANIVLFNSTTNEMFTGTVTNPDGNFKLEKIRPGKYYLEIKYIGYEKDRVNGVTINSQSRHIDIGIVKLNKADYQTDEVEVVAEKTLVEYKIDKKIINVGQQATSLSGSAVDALESSPSIRVDIDGTVSLRGSTSFTLLIDGKPSILDPSDALEQLPASAIDNIEIITNPSAKYDPEGTSGIINVILKRNELSGLSGLVNLNLGTQNNYGGDALIDYKHNGLSMSLGVDYGDRNRPGVRTEYRETIANGLTSILESKGERERGGDRLGTRGAISYNFTDKDNLSASFRFGKYDHGSSSGMDFEEWTSEQPQKLYYSSSESSKRDGEYYRLSMDYTHLFGEKDHKLFLEASYSDRDGDEISTTELINDILDITDSRKYIESGPSKNWRLKAEYKLPLNETDYFETGYQARLDNDKEFNENYLLDLNSGNMELQEEYSHSTKNIKDIHSLFATYAAEAGSFGFQLGLRGEYTYRDIELIGENKNFTIDRVDLFPTLHTSYKVDDTFSLMASYSRRIHRPRGHYLEPFETWVDAYNVRIGNPELEPEYINSFEAGLQKHFEDVSFSLESYYRYTTNTIERVRSVFTDNVFLHSMANVGETYALGAEMMFTFNPIKFWNINLTADLYDYRQEGKVLNQDFESSSFNYTMRMNNRFVFSKTFGTQLDLRWNSPTTTAQGSRKGNFMLSASASYQIIPKSLTAILQIRDILSSRKGDWISEGTGFYTHTMMEPDSPYFSITIRYSINNYKNGKKNNENGEGGEGMDEGDI